MDDSDKTNDDSLLWSLDETAIHLHVSPRTVHRLIARGVLPIVKIERCIRVPKQAVFDWIQAQTRYNGRCVGSAVQERRTCHINAKEVRSGGYRSPTQTVNELDALLERCKRRKQ